MCECLLATPSFLCIGAGTVPPPISCQTLGRVARRKARHLALVEAPILFFSVVFCCQNFKICEYLLAMPSFQCIGGGSVPPPMPCRTLGRAPKGASPSLGGGLNAIFCLVSGASSVGKRVAGVKEVWKCSVLLAVWRRDELRILKLREFFSFADTLADFNAAEQRQPGQQGRVKRPNVRSSAK